jgi:hypothetical protein
VRTTFAGFDSTPRSADLTPEDRLLDGFRLVMRAEDAKPEDAGLSCRYSIREEISSVTTFGGPEDSSTMAEFLKTIRAEEPGHVNAESCSFLHEIISAIASAQQFPMEERVARIRHRINTAQAQRVLR